MERRGQNSHSQITQESPVKLPLAPIVSTPPERRGNNSSLSISTRRGSSIFSPTQTLTHHKESAPDPDPPTPSTAAVPPSVPPPPPPTIRYRECLKNHAASMGAHVVDGCGEFMPSGGEGTVGSLRCAACDCHRNFHRKEVDGELQNRTPLLLQGQNQPSMMPHKRSHSYPTPPMMVNFGGNSGGGGGGGDQSSSEDLNVFQTGQGVVQPSRKRFRTKFSQEQKDGMQELAEKIGWRIQKENEDDVQRFCNESGVKRQVFKVWMHNNKQAIKKRQL